MKEARVVDLAFVVAFMIGSTVISFWFIFANLKL